MDEENRTGPKQGHILSLDLNLDDACILIVLLEKGATSSRHLMKAMQDAITLANGELLDIEDPAKREKQRAGIKELMEGVKALEPVLDNAQRLTEEVASIIKELDIDEAEPTPLIIIPK